MDPGSSQHIDEMQIEPSEQPGFPSSEASNES
jgi:hypothetical protein